MPVPKSAILDHLSSLKLPSIINEHNVVTLSDDSTIEKALSVLERNNIRSAPVLNTSNESHPNRVLGIVGTIDICYFLLQLTPNPYVMSQRELNRLFIEGSTIANEKVYRIVDKSTLNPVETFLISAKLPSVVSTCLAHGVHRVLIMEDNNIIATVSRSDLIRVLHEEIKKGVPLMKEFANLPISGTVFNENHDLVTCKDTDPVLVALDKLRDSKHKSLPVVDGSGKLVSNFSGSDISALVRDAWPSFGDNVLKYRDHVYKLKNRVPKPLTYLNRNATIGEAIEALIGGKQSIHCLWVVDSNQMPIGSISLTDILRFTTTWKNHE